MPRNPPDPAQVIPVIDLVGSFSPSLDERMKVAREANIACRDIGFFYVRNHGVPDDAIRAAREVARQFFDLPDERKMQLVCGHGFGYDPPGKQALEPGTPPDLKDSFLMVAPPQKRADDVPWPDELPAFRWKLEAYQAHLQTLGQHLMRCIALSLDLPEDYFDEACEAPNCAIPVLHYPPRPPGALSNQIGAGAHTDWGAITMLHQDEIGGLEVLNADGEWIEATPIEGTFVINLGDLIRRWTNDRYRSTTHRVVHNAADRPRFSMSAFFSPRDDYPVRCLPTCREEGEAPHYPACSVDEHFQEMMRRSYEITV